MGRSCSWHSSTQFSNVSHTNFSSAAKRLIKVIVSSNRSMLSLPCILKTSMPNTSRYSSQSSFHGLKFAVFKNTAGSSTSHFGQLTLLIGSLKYCGLSPVLVLLYSKCSTIIGQAPRHPSLASRLNLISLCKFVLIHRLASFNLSRVSLSRIRSLSRFM